MKKISWGVLGTANIGIKKVIPAMKQGRFTAVDAIASRDVAKAEKVARELGIPKAYGTYEALLADPTIDAIYIPLPNHLHVEWTIKSLEAGKHVLCEKPLALNLAEAEFLLKERERFPDLKVMEAFMYRLHAQWRTAKKMVEDGAIGELKTIHSFFSYFNDDPANIRNRADIGGGGLMDIGCYCISLSRFIFNQEPNRVMGIIEFDPQMKIDRLASGILDFSKGTATFTCGTQIIRYQRVNIFGTKGRIEIEIPFNAPPDKLCRLFHEDELGIKEIQFGIQDQYTIQGDGFSQAILNHTSVPTALHDGVANMKVIERIFESARKNSWIEI